MSINVMKGLSVMTNELLILHPGRANLPELQAYSKFFSQKYKITVSTDYKQDLTQYDVIWIIMGVKTIRKARPNQVIIHEYASLSTGRLAKLKNLVKKVMTSKPDIRIFLNEFVKDELSFNDDVTFCYRDMGISEVFLDRNVTNPIKYDFVYVGDISKERKMDIFLEDYIINHKEKLLLVGKYDLDIYSKFSECENIIFTGKIPYNEVPYRIKEAKYAINFIPNEYPYNFQTSTKLQEYVALGMKIITCYGEWTEQFEKENHCNFFYMDKKNYMFSDKYKTFNYVSNIEGKKYLWKNILEKSNISNIIEKKLKNNNKV